MSALFPFDNSYARLDAKFYALVTPTPVQSPGLIIVNQSLARQLGLDPDALTTPEAVGAFAGNSVPEGAEPLAMVYAGHQFGHYSPRLGDGRAILLGEVVDRDGIRRDIQLKGSGLTPFSRRGDGRAALGPVLREYLVSEAFVQYGIPTTRSLAAVTTGERVYREVPLPGGVLTRVATSHVRIGTFQFFAARRDHEAVRQLADYMIKNHFAEVHSAANPYYSFLQQVIERQARLIVQWLAIGFIHGVMNTDNMSIVGETIDFGPCAFMDAFQHGKVFSSIDEHGRYAYGNQATIAVWNLSRLAECLLPLLDDHEDKALELANQALSQFAPTFNEAYLKAFRAKLGLVTPQPDDLDLVHTLLGLMEQNHADFTLTFRRLSQATPDSVRALFSHPAEFDPWYQRWQHRLTLDEVEPSVRLASMQAVNPAVIPRNHRIEEVIRAAVDDGDFKPFHALHQALSAPYADNPEYEIPPRPSQLVHQTFCGT